MRRANFRNDCLPAWATATTTGKRWPCARFCGNSSARGTKTVGAVEYRFEGRGVTWRLVRPAALVDAFATCKRNCHERRKRRRTLCERHQRLTARPRGA